MATVIEAIKINTTHPNPQKIDNRKIADEHFSRGENDIALQHYDLALREDPGNIILHNFRGITLKRLGRLTEALATFDAIINFCEKNIVSDSKIIPFVYNKAMVCELLGQNDDIILCCQRILACAESSIVDPLRITAYHLMADALFNRGDYRESIKNYEHAIRLRSWQDQKKNIRMEDGKDEANALGQELMRKANAGNSKVQKEKEEYSWFAMHYSNGLAHYKLNKYEVALMQLDVAGENSPKDINTHFLKALCYYRLGNFKMASEYFDTVLLLNQSIVNVWYNKGLADFELAKSAKTPSLGDFNTALDCLKEAKALAPNDMDIVRAEGIVLNNPLYLELLRKEQAKDTKDTKDKKEGSETNKTKEGLIAIASSEPKPFATAQTVQIAAPILYAATTTQPAPSVKVSMANPASVSQNPPANNNLTLALEPKIPHEPTKAPSFVLGNASFN